MTQQFFVNLPVKNVKKSMEFWKAVGYTINPQLTGDGFTCVTFGENFFAMLLEHEKFNQFAPSPIVDATKTPTVIVGLGCESRADVENKVRRALEAGAKRHGEPEDHDFMYQDAFVDLDGHGWAVTYFVPAKP
ncbi:MAG TPA: hypothetical protein VFO10_10745 [Oligoflexus sp.]|uniref:VOC family protein n=1 Tax=Oligoflexus sp. TaxID=1971216 RepID=UPI002D805FE4|nr:hypothetical protein [Oligoflexus sp.]HET9237722.1 hypothetical protein [Oligoflexus sp.]